MAATLLTADPQASIAVRVLGSAAGGGFPQWNCNCTHCHGVRAGTGMFRRRTQSSVAIRGAGDGWVLVNASPDVLAQVTTDQAFHPGREVRDTALQAIVLTDAQLDHTVGLLMLRESTRPLTVWCTDPVHHELTARNPIFNLLQHYCGIDRRRLSGEPFTVEGAPDLRWRAIPLPGKAPPYSDRRTAGETGNTIALGIESIATGRRIVYAPGVAEITPDLWTAMQAADCVLVDGTFFTDDELIRHGCGHKSSAEMGHLPQSGPGGMVEWLNRLPLNVRRILIHINNTNPILDEESAQRALLWEYGIEIAYDGLQIEL